MNGISRRGLLKTGVAAGVLGLTGLPVRAQARGGKFTAGLNGANTIGRAELVQITIKLP